MQVALDQSPSCCLLVHSLTFSHSETVPSFGRYGDMSARLCLLPPDGRETNWSPPERCTVERRRAGQESGGRRERRRRRYSVPRQLREGEVTPPPDERRQTRRVCDESGVVRQSWRDL